MYYRNLVEDEKEAGRERFWTRMAMVAIIAGLFYLWFRSVKKE